MYKLCERTIISEGEAIKSYGICFDDDIFFEDVSTEKAYVERLVDLFNAGDVLPEYAPELIEDFISGGGSF